MQDILSYKASGFLTTLMFLLIFHLGSAQSLSRDYYPSRRGCEFYGIDTLGADTVLCLGYRLSPDTNYTSVKYVFAKLNRKTGEPYSYYSEIFAPFDDYFFKGRHIRIDSQRYVFLTQSGSNERNDVILADKNGKVQIIKSRFETQRYASTNESITRVGKNFISVGILYDQNVPFDNRGDIFIAIYDSAFNEVRTLTIGDTRKGDVSYYIIPINDSIAEFGYETGWYRCDRDTISVENANIGRISITGKYTPIWQSSNDSTFGPFDGILNTNGDRILLFYDISGSWCENDVMRTAIIVGYSAIMKLDKNLNIVWKKRLGKQANILNTLRRMKKLSDGNYLAIGNTADRIGDTTVYNTKGYIVKFNDSGRVLWERRYRLVDTHSSNDNIFTDFIEMPNGELLVSGYLREFHNTAPNKPVQRGWYLKLYKDGTMDTVIKPPVHIQEIVSWNHIHIYPNPTSDVLNINLEEAPNSSSYIKLYTSSGQEIYRQKITGSKPIQIPMSQFPQGLLILNFYNDTGQMIFSTKVRKE